MQLYLICYLVAYSLGFKETEKGTETPYGYLSRRNSDNEFPMDIIWGGNTPLEESNAIPSPSTSTSSSGSTGSPKSKNNKKKKKKSNKK